VTIRNEYLQEFEDDCTTKDQDANEREIARICQTKKQPENRVGAEALNDSEKLLIKPARHKRRSRVNRRQRQRLSFSEASVFPTRPFGLALEKFCQLPAVKRFLTKDRTLA
jgi:hypothetical protein